MTLRATLRKADLKRAILAAHETGYRLKQIRPDGTMEFEPEAKAKIAELGYDPSIDQKSLETWENNGGTRKKADVAKGAEPPKHGFPIVRGRMRLRP
mgnify:CR=1 FL=1